MPLGREQHDEAAGVLERPPRDGCDRIEDSRAPRSSRVQNAMKDRLPEQRLRMLWGGLG